MVSAVLEVAEPRRVPSGDFEVSSGDREAPLADGLAAHASARRWHAPEAHRRVVTSGAIGAALSCPAPAYLLLVDSVRKGEKIKSGLVQVHRRYA